MKPKKPVTTDEILEVLIDFRDAVAHQFALIDKHFEAIDRRFDGNDRRFESIEALLQGIDTRLTALEVRVGRLETRIEDLETEMRRLRAEVSGYAARQDADHEAIQRLDRELSDARRRIDAIDAELDARRNT